MVRRGKAADKTGRERYPFAIMCEAPPSTVCDDDAPFERIDGARASGVLFLCDHASNRVPAPFGALGLPPAEFARHIAYDIGAARLTRRLAALAGAPALLTRFSRLVIDPNRGEDDPTLVMRLSDGAVVPGNAAIDAAGRADRIARLHRPYHAAIAAELDAFAAAGVVPAIVSLHSFTPAWKGRARPWHVAVLWDADPRLSRDLIAALAADGDLVVGDNQPYDGALEGDTLNRHGTARGLPHTLIEVRQDLVADDAGADAWADRLWAALAPILADPALHRIERHGSRTGRHRRRRPGESG
ncbi:N-formylglutamate amidohydrolase [Pleomorphomonas sp. SM30]|uniref:Putative N-formylglutamate amidohydrolase n=2 Tax=Oharaeibacter diazotrophicus TaxID=1920512 RepID=A0A4R6RF23_9HYPH|nr:putative N-formylglutamate amidohydrolase [Oharaeibacter diazotrophicus]BBE73911.1 N-formylglutamate amidohydrolase [Pleomorphomonas sp. SM30]GLS76404.1 N-formylglutamate amidohydrolase [Oharaeibacter diazotrophicus]